MERISLTWSDQLEKMIQKHHMLSHPFYQAWTCGHLTVSQLRKYAKEYYHHVNAFPTYLSALHSRCSDETIRRSLLNNLIDEEGGDPTHPALWKRFLLALGVSQKEIETHQPSMSTRALIESFKNCCTRHPISVGLAALYCYESQIPAICETKIAGLKNWYGITNPEEYRYFSVHQTADIEHALEEKKMLQRVVVPEEEEVVLRGADKILRSLEEFLSSFLSYTDC